MNGIKELSGKKGIGSRISSRCFGGSPFLFCCWPPWFKFADVNLSAPCSLATPHTFNLQENGGFHRSGSFYTQPGKPQRWPGITWQPFMITPGQGGISPSLFY